MGHNLLRRYGFNQRTMALVEQENSQPQYSTHHFLCKKKNCKWQHFQEGSFFAMSVSCWSSRGWEIKAVPSPQMALLILGGTGYHSTHKFILRHKSASVLRVQLPHREKPDLQQIRESENPGKFTLCCFRLHKICFIACLHKILL